MKKMLLVLALALPLLAACAPKHTAAQCRSAAAVAYAGDPAHGNVVQENFDAHMAWLKAVQTNAECVIQEGNK